MCRITSASGGPATRGAPLFDYAARAGLVRSLYYIASGPSCSWHHEVSNNRSIQQEFVTKNFPTMARSDINCMKSTKSSNNPHFICDHGGHLQNSSDLFSRAPLMFCQTAILTISVGKIVSTPFQASPHITIQAHVLPN